MSSLRDAQRPDVVDATARRAKDTVDDVREARLDRSVGIEQTIDVDVCVVCVEKRVDRPRCIDRSLVECRRAWQAIVDGKRVIEVAYDDDVLDIARPRDKLVVERASCREVVVMRGKVIEPSGHVDRGDEDAMVRLKLQHGCDETAGGRPVVGVAVWDEIVCDEQSHTGVVAGWTRRRHDSVLRAEVGCQRWIADLLESDHTQSQAEAATENVGQLAKQSQADVQRGDAERRGGDRR